MRKRITARLLASCVIACVAFSSTGCVTGRPESSPSTGPSKPAAQAPGMYRFGPLSFQPFSNMRVLPANEKELGNAAAELQSRDDYRGYPQRIYIFSDPNSVGNIGIRLSQIKENLKAQLAGQGLRFTDDHDINVPGTVQSHILSYTIVNTDTDGTKIPMIQHEILLATDHNPQYGLRVSSPARMYRPTEMQRLLRTIRLG